MDLTAQSCLCISQRCGRIDIHILSLEDRMTGYIYLYKKVASRAAVCTRLSLLTDAYALSIVDTGRDRNLNLLARRSISCSTAGTAFVLDDLTGSITVRTGLYITDHTKHGLLCIDNLTFTFTFRTGNWLCSWFCTCSMAGSTFILQHDLQFFVTAKYSFFKSNIYTGT